MHPLCASEIHSVGGRECPSGETKSRAVVVAGSLRDEDDDARKEMQIRVEIVVAKTLTVAGRRLV